MSDTPKTSKFVYFLVGMLAAWLVVLSIVLGDLIELVKLQGELVHSIVQLEKERRP